MAVLHGPQQSAATATVPQTVMCRAPGGGRQAEDIEKTGMDRWRYKDAGESGVGDSTQGPEDWTLRLPVGYVMRAHGMIRPGLGPFVGPP